MKYSVPARALRAFGLAALIAGTALAASSAHAEKVLRYANDGDLETLDPQLNSTVQEDRALFNVFLGLVTEAADGVLIPGAAESWTISPDGLVYTFKMRPHTWSDGVPVTAEDFVFSFRRLLTPETAAQYASQLYTIKNGQAVNEGKVKPEELGVKALDPQTLQVTLEFPAPYFLGQLAHHSALPVPKHIVEKVGKDWAKPGVMVGNGPFNLVSFTPNDQTVLVKNPKFYDAANVKLDKAIFYAIEDLTEQVKRFRAGDVEVTGEIPPDQLEWLNKNLADETQVKPYLGLHYYSLNTTKPPFNDIRVRKALSMAIDREAMSNKVMKTGEVPAYSFVPPDIEGYGKPSEVEWRDWPMDKRIAEAKKLLAEAGYGPNKPLKFQLRYNTSEEHKRRAIAVAAMWKQNLGVQAELFNTEIKIHYAELREKNFEAARAGWIGDYPDPQNFLYIQQTSTGPMNYSGYSNPEYDSLMEQSGKTMDVEERSKLMHKAEAISMRDEPVIPLAFYVSKHLVSKKVQGWKYNILDHHRLRWMDIAQ